MRILIVLCCLSWISCNPSQPKGFFKYYDGYHIGDFISLPSNEHEIRNDTLFIGGKPKAKYIDMKKRINGNTILTVKSFHSNEKGMYIKK